MRTCSKRQGPEDPALSVVDNGMSMGLGWKLMIQTLTIHWVTLIVDDPTGPLHSRLQDTVIFIRAVSLYMNNPGRKDARASQRPF